jgi:hypothetical protein
MEKEEAAKKQAVAAQLSKKYNLEAMSSYNFDNIDFDVDFGTVDEKTHQKMVKETEQLEKD